MRSTSLLVIFSCLFLFACKEKQKSSSAEEKTAEGKMTDSATVRVIDSSETYFSIKQYFNDQWNTRRNNPYTLLRIARTGTGRPDSSYVGLDSPLWFSLRAYFDAADIGGKQFLGQYKFDMFTDEQMEVTHLHYEALSPQLFLQKMDITADMFSNLVKSVYMETRREQEGSTTSQKLQYIPDRIFQIQEFEKKEGAAAKNTLLEYRFNY